MNAWDGIASSIVAAVIAALVAVLVVHLSNRSARKSWYHQRRVEAFTEVLDGWNECWEVASRNWDSYPPREFTPSLPAMEEDPERAPIIDQMLRRDQDLQRAVGRTAAAVEKWALYLGTAGAEIEQATRRAIDVLDGEWRYTSYLGRGGLYLPIPDQFYDEWKRYLDASHEWHRAPSRRKRKKPDARLTTMWRSTPKTTGDILNVSTELRFLIE